MKDSDSALPLLESSSASSSSSSSSSSSCSSSTSPQADAPPLIQPQGKASNPTPSIRCWAHTRGAQRCRLLVRCREGEPIPIPYCNRHLKSGDGALKVVQHPFAGQCLVARHDLPVGYRLVFHGSRGKCATSDLDDRSLSFYPPNPISGSNYYTETNAVTGVTTKKRKINNYNGVLRPKGTGDMLQYAACPGPTERQNVKSNFQFWGIRNGSTGGAEFVTCQEVPAGTQLCFWYGNGWWNARDMKRRDVGTAKYPAPKRRVRGGRGGHSAAVLVLGAEDTSE